MLAGENGHAAADAPSSCGCIACVHRAAIDEPSVGRAGCDEPGEADLDRPNPGHDVQLPPLLVAVERDGVVTMPVAMDMTLPEMWLSS